ncbi:MULTISPECIES: oxygen-dependent coproporphyrinogen oxidase [Chryseobacterium]|jgi:coproporphyrinogen III oxidase|uniref:coproporphyrinogen oxidase n=1 Tax=Chryseobacterium geocarposphaerae TaxID=1416776 RepID=A0ABU1LBG7_9FLAO|nr:MULTISPECIES: oxygen-dependent coproporphyrinogen oxidase [Chryseobacterium]MDR6404066.1 coproporphyrinogen III oxidase [Chryseobacterium geocarposphaerae]MDR6698415.1 coproporphyrinogen III oxidase [Chryseobacterium ginsenosidimutans]
MNIKNEFIYFIQHFQNEICNILEEIDGKSAFKDDFWERSEGGGGRTRVIAEGNIFEKGGVNTSVIHGELPEIMARQFDVNPCSFMASGISIVIHPINPFVPTIHANFRYFELYNSNGQLKDSWFGGGIDLTPFYLDEMDGNHFHRTLKEACDSFGPDLYPTFKEKCDKYFVNKHRNNEARGIGGIFYDYLRPLDTEDAKKIFELTKANGNAFLNAYLPLIIKNKDIPYTEAHRRWQAYRRSRYVEFNLIHDRGTSFGLKTNGRIESIFMSLPPVARWEYDFQPVPGSPEAQLVEWLKPRDWINI